MTLQKLKFDPHVHSIYSNRPAEYLLRKVGFGECYTRPKQVYEVCKKKGMDLVTITDHDTIDGALEIAHLDGAFISEEITAVFPEDGVHVHVIALDIDESQHLEIQKLREDIYQLVRYLRQAEIPHYVAHPLSQVKGRLDGSHIQKMLLMFSHLEGMNGSRDPIHGKALSRILERLSTRQLNRWAEIHDLEPVDWSPRRFLVAGSDDHGWLNMTRAYTELDVASVSRQEMCRAFNKGLVEMCGEYGSPDVLAHNIYSVAYQYFQNTTSRSMFSEFQCLSNTTRDQSEPVLPGISRRSSEFVDIICGVFASMPDVKVKEIIENGQLDEAHEKLGLAGRLIINSLLTGFVSKLLDAIGKLDLERAFEQVPGILSAGSVLLPYLFGYRYYVRDREDARRIAVEIVPGFSAWQNNRVAIFSDTGLNTDKASTDLRNLIQKMQQLEFQVQLVTCATIPEEHPAGMHNLTPVGQFAFPFFETMNMGIPSLVDVMKYLAESHVSVVQLATPGPLGLVGLLAAKLMGIPIVSNYPTELLAQAARLTDDTTVTSITARWIGWFYGLSDCVLVSSQIAKESLVSLGVDQEAIRDLKQKEDTTHFSVNKAQIASEATAEAHWSLYKELSGTQPAGPNWYQRFFQRKGNYQRKQPRTPTGSGIPLSA